jgi:hypothetical protein
MSNHDHGNRRRLSRLARLRKHQERLGTLTPACVVCGLNDPRCLQLDHIVGQEFTDEDVPICANHHLMRTDLSKDHPPKDADPSDGLEQAGRFLHGLADYFELLEPICRKYGDILCAEAATRSPRQKQGGGRFDSAG